MGEVERFARHGGLVLGICNGFQVLCEAGLLSGALLPNTSLRFICRQVGARGRQRVDGVDGRVLGGRAALDPGQAHDGPLLGARSGARRARGQRPGRAALRRRRELQRLGAGHRGRLATPRATSSGLMPHPEHAVDPLTGSADGLKLFLSGRPGAAREQASRARAHRLRVRPDRLEARPRAERGRARRLLADVVRALRLQALAAAAEDAADRGAAARAGAGRERGRGVGRRRAGVRVQGRVAQPPERGRAVRGRRDRRRRHPARHLRDRRAADRDPGLAALRRGRRRPPARATCSSARWRGSATTATRSGSRPSAARSTSRARTSRTASSTRWRRADRDRQADPSRPPPASATSSCCSGRETGRDGIGGASVLASAELDDSEDKRPTVQIGDPFDGEEAARVLAGAARPRAAGRAAGPRRRRA